MANVYERLPIRDTPYVLRPQGHFAVERMRQDERMLAAYALIAFGTAMIPHRPRAGWIIFIFGIVIAERWMANYEVRYRDQRWLGNNNIQFEELDEAF